MIDRRNLLGAMAAVAAGPAAPMTAGRSMEHPHTFDHEDDFDELWGTIERRYPFFPDKATDWNRVRAFYRPLAIAAANDAAFVEVIRRTLWELYDTHCSVHDLPAGTQRNPPGDLLAARSPDGIVVTALEPEGAAARVGMAIGDRIVAVDGQPIARRVAALTPRCLKRADPAADAFAVNAAVAGLRQRPRRFTLMSPGGAAREVVVPYAPGPARPDIEWRMLDGAVGYVVIRAFSDDKVVDGFNRALEAFRDTRGLIIDVRDNGGGDTAVARPIMGRFIAEPKPYALMRRREGTGLGAPWTEWVDPRGPFTYAKPVVVLCSHWSGSMAEGFPMGMRDIGRSTIVGTPMMGLGAAVYEFRLDRTGLQGQYSAEPVYDTRGQPRWLLRPDVVVPRRRRHPGRGHRDSCGHDRMRQPKNRRHCHASASRLTSLYLKEVDAEVRLPRPAALVTVQPLGRPRQSTCPCRPRQARRAPPTAAWRQTRA